MRSITVLNQKGGVGKTTTVANLGACLAELGRKVLVVDVDPQANLSIHFGTEMERGEPSTYTLMQGEHVLADVVRATPLERLHLVPSNVDLAGLSIEMGDRADRYFVLREALAPAAAQFDYVLMDSPPSLGLLTLNAMCAAREVFIPLQTQFFALQGLGKLVRTVDRVRASVNREIEITGVIACMYDSRTRLAQEILDEIKGHFGPRVFQTIIRQNIRLAEAPGFGLPITRYDPACHGAQDYRALAAEVVAMETAALAAPAAPAAPEAPEGPKEPGALAAPEAPAAEAPPPSMLA